MATQWCYQVFGEEFGPVDEAALFQLYDGGTLSASDQIRRADQSEWQPLDHLLKAGPSLNGSAVAAATVEAADSPDEELNWYYKISNEVLGPLTFRELLDLGEAGALSSDSEVRFGVSGKFRSVGSIGRLVAVLPYQLPEPKTSPGVKSKTVSIAATPAPPPPAPPVPVKRYLPQAEEATWYAWIRGTEYGPTNLLQLSQWVTQGQLAPTDFVKYGPYGGWMPPAPTIEQTLAQFTVVEMAPTPAPAPVPTVTASPAPAAAAPVTSASTANKPTTTTPPAAPAKVDPVPAAKPEPVAAKETPAPKAEVAEKPAKVAEVAPVAPAAEPARPMSSYSGSGMSGGMGMGMGGAVARPAAPISRPKKSSGGGSSIDFGAILGDKNVLLAIGAIVAVGALVGAFFFLPASTGPDKEKLQKLQQALATFRQFREEKAGSAEWQAYEDNTKKMLSGVAEELKTTASRKYPQRQFLLWAARDRFPEVISGAKEKANGAEAELEYNLKKAAFYLNLGTDPDLNQKSSPAVNTPD